ncbi:MAG TPA: cyclic nucleotide-binding domain-containing protein [Sumerlaeia bacterium]|nr:cyclic nucleotide-binding domain-containing protein [Sumerlaeia bacterium]
MAARFDNLDPRGLKSAGLSQRERSELIDRIQWLKDLSWQQVELLAGCVEAFAVAKGEEIFREGDRPAFMCLIGAGRVSIVKEDSSSSRKKITNLGRGQAFGEMSLVDGEPRSATVLAATNVLLLLLTRENFYSLLEDYPPIGVKVLLRIMRSMSQRLRMTSGVLVDALEHPTGGRRGKATPLRGSR